MALPLPCTRCGTLAEDPVEVEVAISHGREGRLCVGCSAKFGGCENAVKWLKSKLEEESKE